VLKLAARLQPIAGPKMNYVAPIAPLFVPPDRPDRFQKAAASGAYVVIVDLEDGVRPDRKQAGRDALPEALGLGATVFVRIDPQGSPC
jgi:citrate lyase subunit beta/citryl-CoA lyase